MSARGRGNDESGLDPRCPGDKLFVAVSSIRRRCSPGSLASMALVAVLGSCGNGDDDDAGASQTSIGAVCEPAPQESEAALELAEAYCAELFGCHCPLQETYGSLDDCVLDLSADFQFAFDKAVFEGLTYAPGCADLQLSNTRVFGCGFPDVGSEARCVDVQCDPFAGERLVGEACTAIDAGRVGFSDCAPGLVCKSDCGHCVDERRRGEGETCGTCFGFCEEHLVCSLSGEALEGTCVARSGGAQGDACQTVLDCKNGLYCSENECAPRLEEGGECQTGVECALGLYCAAGRCTPLKRTGESCTASAECAGACSSQGLCTFPLCLE
jgi:hypothetical protein